jgi:hypothetical protein
MNKNLMALAVLAVAALPALAVDGQILINQSTVTAAGGFPYVITQPGSYKLSGNLSVSSTTSYAIKIQANFVTIDLNGFAIIGPGLGSGLGICSCNLPFQPPVHSTVVNGAVTGFGGGGIVLGDKARVQNAHVSNNGAGGGIQVGIGSLIIGNVVDNNADSGIIASTGSVIRDNTVTGNLYGIVPSCPAVIVANSVTSNTTNIDVGVPTSCTLSQNVPAP